MEKEVHFESNIVRRACKAAVKEAAQTIMWLFSFVMVEVDLVQLILIKSELNVRWFIF